MARPFRIGATRHMMDSAHAGARRAAPCQQVCEPIMTKPSERIVVFVTPAQKRAIAATADELGISVSELMRRAVLNFGATSEQVKAASIVDRLNVPRAPNALDAALARVARGTRHTRAALPPALQTRAGSQPAPLADSGSMPPTPSASSGAGAAASATAEPAPLLPADVLAALSAEVDEDAVATAEAVARIAAARAAASDSEMSAPVTTQTHVKSMLKRPRLDNAQTDDDPQRDLGAEGGRFA
jgi:hypothetical protein